MLRVRATPQRGDHVESLLFAFPMVLVGLKFLDPLAATAAHALGLA